MPVHPELRWAQRSSESEAEKNVIYLSVNLPEIKESSLELKLDTQEISFSAEAGRPEERKYEFKLKLYGEIDPENSKRHLTTRSLELVLRKKELKLEYWPRLTEDKKVPFIKTDFERWVDEDEQDAVEDSKGFDDDMGMGGMGGMPGMGGMGGMPGMGGMGGMPGMGGLGGMPGMGGMGGMGGMPGMPEGMDFEKMMAEMKNSEGAGGIDAADDDSDDGDDGPPPLEDAETPVAGGSSS